MTCGTTGLQARSTSKLVSAPTGVPKAIAIAKNAHLDFLRANSDCFCNVRSHPLSVVCCEWIKRRALDFQWKLSHDEKKASMRQIQIRLTTLGSVPEFLQLPRNPSKPPSRFRDCGATSLIAAYGWGGEVHLVAFIAI
jgi:hypothetical protein